MYNVCRGCVCFLFLSLIISIGILIQSKPQVENEEDPERKTFTWLGSPPSEELADWLEETSFTDVAIRAWSEEANFTKWYDILETRDITMWSIWGFYSNYNGPEDTDGFIDLLEDYVSRSPNGNVYLDDCHTLSRRGIDVFNNLLTAIRDVQTMTNGESNIIVCYYYIPPSGANLTDIDLDIYSETDFSIRNIPDIDCNSLGAYVWSWRQGWANMNLAYIRSQYSEAGEREFRRMTAWSGYEPDYYPHTQMYNANLFNFAGLTEEIRIQNENFLGSE